jgi:two-component system, cell cycle sensor histidine kinase and response regulator CckA
MDHILGTDKELTDEVSALRLLIAGHERAEAQLRAENERLRTSLKISGDDCTESRHRYHRLFNEAVLGIALCEIICNADGEPADFRFLEVNLAFEKHTGLKVGEVTGKTVREILPTTESYWLERYGKVALTGEAMIFSAYHKEVDKHFEISAFSPKDGQFAVIFNDITAREQMRMVLAESEEKFRALCNSSPIGIFMADSQGQIIYSNPRLEEISGLSTAEVLGNGWYRAIHPDDREETLRLWGEMIATGCPYSFEPRLLTSLGMTPRMRILVNPIKDPNGRITGYVGTVEDITDLSQAREEMIKVQKLESLGIVAGGIAHDFNNILTGILGNISLAQRLVEEASKAHEPLKEAEKASERAVALSRQILTFAKGGDPVKKAVAVKYLVAESVSIALRGSNVQGVIDIPDGISAIEVDETQMLQALTNVVINAAQAMPNGGKLTVEAEQVSLANRNRLKLQQGEYVKITVSDQGCGIPDAILGKIFDPYFTTKPDGTGLGLASTYSIIAKHGGHVGAHSLPERGAAFTLHLPSCAETHAACDASQMATSEAGPHQGGAILVMDDELIIRRIVAKMLECLGYRVTVCENGTEAISLFKAANDAGTPFEAVIMDLTIPGGMGGKEAARHLLAIDPLARLIVSSGYSNDPVMANFKSYGFCSVMPKPYKISDMSAVLANLPPKNSH